ncbi:MAG: hypothetical protein WAV05_15405, partial [Anaerolineales bacterium]
LNMSAGQQVLRRLDPTYKQFFKGKRRFPRFKKASRFNSVNYKPGDGAQVKDNRLYVQNVGFIKVRWHRELPESKLKNIVVLPFVSLIPQPASTRRACPDHQQR